MYKQINNKNNNNNYGNTNDNYYKITICVFDMRRL